MERLELPNLETRLESRDLVKTPDLDDDSDILEEDLSPLPGQQSFGLLTAFGWFISVAWVAGVLAFAVGYYGPAQIVQMPPIQILAGIAATVFPVILVILLTAMAKRMAQLNRTADKLAVLAGRLTEPEHKALNEVADLSLAIRREMDRLDHGLDATLNRFHSLKSEITACTKDLGATVNDAKDQMAGFKSTLETERTQLSDLTKFLDTETSSIGTLLGSGADDLRAKIDKILSEMTAAEQNLARQLGAIETAADSAAGKTKQAGEDLAAQCGALESAAERALQKSATIAERYGKQRAEISEAAGQLSAENDKFETLLSKQSGLLGASMKDLSERTTAIEKTLSSSVSNFEETILGIMTRAAELSRDLDSHAGQAKHKSEDAVASLEKATAAAKAAAEQILEAFDGSDTAIEEQLSKTQTAAETAVDRIRASIRDSSTDLGRDVETATAALDAAVGDATRRLEQQVADLRRQLAGSGQALGDAAELVQDDVRERLVAFQNEIANSAVSLDQIAASTRSKLEQEIAKFRDEIAGTATSLEGHVDAAKLRLAGHLGEFESRIGRSKSLVDSTLSDTQSAFDELGDRFDDRVKGSIDGLSKVTGDTREHVAALAEDLRAEITRAQQSLADASQDARADFESQLRDLRNELENARASVEEVAEGSRGQIDLQIDDMRAQIAGISDEVEKAARSARGRLDEELEVIRVHLEESSAFIDTSAASIQAQLADQMKKIRLEGLGLEQILKDSSASVQEQFADVTRSLNDAILAAGQAMGDAARDSEHHVIAAMDDLKGRIVALEDTMGNSSANIGSEIERHITSLRSEIEDSGELLGTITSQIQNRLTAQLEDLNEQMFASHQSMEDAAKMAKTNFDGQLAMIRSQIAEAREMMQDQSATTRDEFEQNVASMRHEISVARGQLEDAVRLVKSGLDEQIAEIRTQIEQSKDLVGEAAQSANAQIRGQIALLRADLDQSRSLLDEATAEARQRLENQFKEISGQIMGSTGLFDDVADRLSGTVEKILSVSGEASEELEATLLDLEARLAEFPEHAHASTAEIRKAIEQQLHGFAQMAEMTMEKTRHLEKEFQNRLQSNRQMLTALRQSAEYQKAQLDQALSASDIWTEDSRFGAVADIGPKGPDLPERAPPKLSAAQADSAEQSEAGSHGLPPAEQSKGSTPASPLSNALKTVRQTLTRTRQEEMARPRDEAAAPPAPSDKGVETHDAAAAGQAGSAAQPEQRPRPSFARKQPPEAAQSSSPASKREDEPAPSRTAASGDTGQTPREQVEQDDSDEIQSFDPRTLAGRVLGRLDRPRLNDGLPTSDPDLEKQIEARLATIADQNGMSSGHDGDIRAGRNGPQESARHAGYKYFNTDPESITGDNSAADKAAPAKDTGPQETAERDIGAAQPDTPAHNRASSSEWSWKDILAAVSEDDLLPAPEPQHTPAARASVGAAKGKRQEEPSTLNRLERLQSLTLDLSRLVDDKLPPDLLERFNGGEKNVFARHLSAIGSNTLSQRIRRRISENSELRDYVDRYVREFKEFITQTTADEKNRILADTYMNSDLGKVYKVLSKTVG